MTTTVLQRRVDIDPLRAAEALSHVPGTLLLHTQREWNGSGRSALLFAPRWILRATPGRTAAWEGTPPPAPLRADVEAELLSAPLRLASRWKGRTRRAPVFAGLAGSIGYDLGAYVQDARHPVSPPFDVADLWLGAYDLALVFGPGESTVRGPWLVAADLSPIVPGAVDLRARWEEGEAHLRGALDSGPPPSSTGPTGETRFFDRDWHRAAVLEIHRQLRAGNSYQINLTGQASLRTGVSPWAAFLDQARRNPVAFAAYLRCDASTTVTSHSPERLLRVRGRRADTAPIKGTAAASEGAAGALRASEKDRAEHVMIVDLCRHDLGRHAAIGSVRVPSLMESLELNRLVHLVSRVEAEVPRRHRQHLLTDLFPGGSITGAPKRSSSRIIAEVERHRRGPYTGSIGFVDRGGHADWNIAIRTAVWQNGEVHFGCGGGIVIDSDPDLEYEEARLKASSFLDSLRALDATPPTRPSAPPLSGAAP